MTERVDFYSGTYRHHTHPVLDAIRKEAFGEDIGQNSWITVDEIDRLVTELGLAADATLLEVGSGSGGPALHFARRFGCRVTGIDSNEPGVATATQLAEAMGVASRVRFQVADANVRLPFDDASFDGLVCFDALNHLPDRALVLREWRRVLRPGRRAVFTDPVVITGPITNSELAERASIGMFLFVPPGVNERLLAEADLRLIRTEDASENAAGVSARRHAAREKHRDELVELEGNDRFEGTQRFLASVHALTSTRQLSRIAYLVERPS